LSHFLTTLNCSVNFYIYYAKHHRQLYPCRYDDQGNLSYSCIGTKNCFKCLKYDRISTGHTFRKDSKRLSGNSTGQPSWRLGWMKIDFSLTSSRPLSARSPMRDDNINCWIILFFVLVQSRVSYWFYSILFWTTPLLFNIFLKIIWSSQCKTKFFLCNFKLKLLIL